MVSRSSPEFWATTDGSGYKEGVGGSCCIIGKSMMFEDPVGVAVVRNHMTAYRGEVEAILLCFEYVWRLHREQMKSCYDRELGLRQQDKYKLYVFADSTSAVKAVNNNFHGCSDDYEIEALKLMVYRKRVVGLCLPVPRNTVRQQACCDLVIAGLRKVYISYMESLTENDEFLEKCKLHDTTKND